jgi:hypothetical protein
MNSTVKHITFTALILSLAASAYAFDDSATDALLGNVEAYLSSAKSVGQYESDLKARLKAIDSIWALGEMGSPQVMEKLKQFYAESDDTIRMNLLVSIGKLKPNPYSAPYLRAVAASPEESGFVRAAAFEMLDILGESPAAENFVPSDKPGIERGDMIFRGGIFGALDPEAQKHLPVGHVGIFTGTEVRNGRLYVMISDANSNDSIPPGVRNISSWENFTGHFKHPYYGNRTSAIRPSEAQRDQIVRMAREMGTRGLRYNTTHFSQKGPKEYDCVGYTEYLYEQAGLNPTEDKHETGPNWPLTPWEQFEATNSNIQNGTPHLPSAETAAGTVPAGAAAILNNGLFGISSEQPEIATNVTSKTTD